VEAFPPVELNCGEFSAAGRSDWQPSSFQPHLSRIFPEFFSEIFFWILDFFIDIYPKKIIFRACHQNRREKKS
jgi:hypothetical protein